MKMLLKGLAVVVVLILLAVLALVFVVDANRFKPRIEALAKDQGIALQINGDLGWNFWPSLGVAVNEVRVAALETPDDSIAELKQASLMLKLMPLLRGDFQVDHIAVDGLHLNLAVDASGKGNWEVFLKESPPASTPVETAEHPSDLTLDIQQFSLSNTRVDYRDEQAGQTLSVHDLNLKLAGVNTRTEPFSVDGDFVLEQSQAGSDKLEVAGKLSTKAGIDQSLNNLSLTDGQLQLTLKGRQSADIALDFSTTVKELQEAPALQGKLTLRETSPRKLLAALGTTLQTANPKVLGKLSVSTDFAGDSNSVKLDNLQLQLDDTELKGSASVAQFDKPSIKATLAGSAFNADDYLPPETEPVEGAPVAPAEDTPLPLDALRALDLNIKLTLQKLIFNKIELDNIDAKILAKNGMLEPSLNAVAYKGKISAKSQLDARGQVAQLQFDAGVEGLELEPLLKDMEMDSNFGLQGAVQVRALGSSQGNSTDALFKAIRANANFSGAQVRVSPINLEQQFCKLVNLVNQTQDPTQSWEKYTELSELSGSFKMRDQIITIDTFKAGVEKLQLGSTGKINLATDEYDIFLPFKLVKDKADTVTADQVAVTTSANGCSVGSFYWLERGLELLRCRGSFGSINPLSDCRPDKDMLVKLTKDFAVYKVKEKHGAKIEEKKQELEEKKQEVKERLEDKKHQLFDKLQQRLNRGSTSSAGISDPAPAPAEGDAPPAETP